MIKQHHPNCEDPRCKVCLDDALKLEDELHKRCGTSKSWCDILGRYRAWMDKEGIKAETEFGWPTTAWYDEENLQRFAGTWRE